MGRRKGEVHEIHRAETDGEGERDLTPSSDVTQNESELVASESQQGEGAFLNPYRPGEGPTDGPQADGPQEQAPQVPAGNPTEREEIKRRNFSRVAGGRVTRILEGLRLLKHCANTATYEWDQSQQEKIFSAIFGLTMEVEAAFKKAKEPRVRLAGPRKPLRFEV